MKYLILTDIVSLFLSILGRGTVTSNPYMDLKSKSYSNVRIYQCEEEVPEGAFDVRISGEKVYFSNGQVYGCEFIDLSKYRTIVFEPSNQFETLRVGKAKQIDVLSMHEDVARDDSFILLALEDGPSNWSDSVFEADTLDFGGQKVIEVAALI